MRISVLSGVLVGAASITAFTMQGRQDGGQRQGAPAPIYRTEVPVSELDVIAGATTDSSIILSIRGKSEPAPSLVLQEGGKTIPSPKIALSNRKAVEVSVKGLKAGTTYDYTLTQGGKEVEGRFTTARKSGQAFTFAIQADSHLDGNTDLKVLERTLGNIVKDKPDFLVDLGDTFMVDKYRNFKDSAKQYDAQRYWFSRLGSQMSVFLCLGNHDGEVGWPGRGGEDMAAWAREQREAIFPVIRQNDFYSGAPKKGLWYSYNWGDATFIILDPFVATTRKTRGDEDGWNWTLGKEQFDWLGKTLKESQSKFKFIFIHHLVGGFGGAEARGGVEAADRFEWGNKEEFPVKREGWAEPIHALMVKYGVTAMFHGHDHLYVRQEKDGVIYMEVPQPGQPRDNAIGSAERYGYKSGTILGSSGHIRVTVGSKTAKLEYVKSLSGPDNGRVVDSVEVNAK
ncbi:MAG: metallophosphoesterase [Fimbriimonadaceae bacterium]|nr:metallophosphoesterase [Fimbriimonadaceae bacterium]